MLHQVGVGALGPVFRTYEPTRDRLVAVKVFRLDIVPEQARALADELSRAVDAGLFHPSIVEPIAAGIEGTLAYRAEEYVAAESLDVAMRHYAPAPLDKALPFITQLAGAIDFARAAGVGHGALHPRDIFVTPDEARATGFGVVEALERAGVRAPVRRPYTAPERIERGDWGTAADVFSLAAIAFELLTGRRPSGTGSQIGALNPGDDERLAAVRSVLARAMDDEPLRRYSNALAFASALESAASGELVEPRTPRATAAVPPVAPPPIPEPSLGEFAVEDELDPIHAAIEDATPARATKEKSPAGIPPLLETAPAASASLAPPVEPRLRDHVEAAGDNRLFTAAEEAESQPADAEARGPLEPAYEMSTSGRDASDEPRFRDREPTFGLEPESRDAPERSRPAILPIAVTLVFGLLAGFAAGYFVGGRDRGPVEAPATAASTRAKPTAPPPNPPAKQFSDQAVTSPAPAGAPPTEAPPTVSEDTPAASARPTPTAPAATTRPPAPAATTGRLVVHSTPARAAVTVNGRWRGRTPLTLDKLAFGRYVVRVVQPGFRVEREDVALSARDAAQAIDVRLTPESAASRTPPARATPPAPRSSAPAASTTGTFTGGLYVDSRPQGATVLLDGRSVGKTPLRLPAVPIGSHVVRIELAEHRAWSSLTRVTSGQESRVTGSLERIQ